MSLSTRSLIAATAGIAALLAAGCVSVPAQAAPDGAMAGRMTGMAGDHQCMMMADHGPGREQADSQDKPMSCKMDCNCPMMQKHGGADAPTAPSLAPPEEHQHSPDAPSEKH